MKNYLLIAATYLCCLSIHAQDYTYSQYYFNRIYLNPAFAGADDVLRMNANHREQWFRVPSDFRASNFVLEGQFIPRNDIPVRLGGALTFLRDVQGEGMLTNTQARATISAVVNLAKKNFLNFGLTTAYVQKQINWDRLVFSDQLDPVLGNIYQSSAPRPGTPMASYTDFDIGMLFRRVIGKSGDGILSFGISGSHITQPNESLLGISSQVPVRFSAHTFSLFRITRTRYSSSMIAPSIIYESQGGLNTWNIGSYIMPFVSADKNSPGTLFGGAWYRTQQLPFDLKNRDAIIIALGFQGKYQKTSRQNDWRYTKYRYWQAGISYDMTVSKLSNAYSGGTLEISLVLGFAGRGVKCPQSAFNNKYMMNIPSVY